MTAVSGAVGAVGSVTASVEVVRNYNTGEISGFTSGGIQAGWNGGASATVSTGFIYGLGNSNSNYSGSFTTVQAGAGAGGFVSSSSGGFTKGPSGVKPTGKVIVAGASLGTSLITTPKGGVSATNYSSPASLGSIDLSSSPLDLTLLD
jgi:hypothetical protein